MGKVILLALVIAIGQLCSAYVVPSGGTGGVQTVYVTCPQYPCPAGSFCITGTPQGNICQQLTWIANNQDYVKRYFTRDDYARYRTQVKQQQPGLLERIDRGVFGGFFGRLGFLGL